MAQRIKTHRSTTPEFVITGNPAKAEDAATLEFADAVFEKPFDGKKLLAAALAKCSMAMIA